MPPRRPRTAVKPRPKTVVEKSAGAVVYYPEKPHKFLLIYGKFWEFPKGIVDVDESEEQAARREVEEETGLQVSFVPGFRETIEYFYRREGLLIKKQVVYFLAKATSKQVNVSWEHRKARWVTFEEAMELLEYANAKQVLAKANLCLEKMDEHSTRESAVGRR